MTVWSGDYLDGNFTATNITAPQTIAEPIPEPGTLLLGAGLGGLAVGVRATSTARDVNLSGSERV